MQDPSASATDSDFDNERIWIESGWARREQPTVFQPPAPTTGDASPKESRFSVDWVDKHHESACPADPAYPCGCTIDVALDALKACRVQLPCPAARCGMWIVRCRACGFSISLATAGRADDPKSVRVPCRLH
jgi:hypothetical protein